MLMGSKILQRVGLSAGWAQEASIALFALAVGFGLMPLLIFIVGSSSLGRYDGATSARLYESLYQSLGAGSLASWIVVLGPYGIYLIAKLLRLWWRASARLA
jgi:hypothetical protein